MKARIVKALRRMLKSLETERTENPKNCPFCGKAGKLHELKGPGEWYVACEDDDACFLSAPYRKDSQGAIAAWNRIQVKK